MYVAGGGFFETDKRRRLAPKAVDPVTRDAPAVALRRRGEIVGADSHGRVFVLRRRDEHTRMPERNLALVSSFGIRGGTPIAVLTDLDDDAGKHALRSTRTNLADRATLFDAANASEKFGPSFSIATREGGLCEVFEVSEGDYTKLHIAQQRMECHPLTRSPLGGVNRTDCASQVVSDKYAALDASRVFCASEPHIMLDGAVLRELLDLPEHAQREVLTCEAQAFPPMPVDATLVIARRALETV